MNSEEVVRRAIEFRYPDRLPFDTPVSGPSDVFRVPSGASSDPRVKASDGTRYVDHFGCGFTQAADPYGTPGPQARET